MKKRVPKFRHSWPVRRKNKDTTGLAVALLLFSMLWWVVDYPSILHFLDLDLKQIDVARISCKQNGSLWFSYFIDLKTDLLNILFFLEDASSSDEEIKQINRELSPKKFTGQLNSMTSARSSGGGNRQLLGMLLTYTP